MTEEGKKGVRFTDIFDDIAFTSEDLLRILEKSIEKSKEEGPSWILLDEYEVPPIPSFVPWWCPLCGHHLEEHHNGRCYRATFLYDRGAHRPPRVMMCPCGRLP